MDIIITQQSGIYFLIWLAFALAGTASWYGWYDKTKYYDRIIHFFSGIVIAMIMVDSGFSVPAIIITNIILGFIWEGFQTKTRKQISWVIYGLPEGYGDIVVHTLGSIVYLFFRGIL